MAIKFRLDDNSGDVELTPSVELENGDCNILVTDNDGRTFIIAYLSPEGQLHRVTQATASRPQGLEFDTDGRIAIAK